ncbi:MAG: decaprenyl-phosphate phosphoribosyltransferase [Chloroflexi bacterium]|nr:decaprenyl-phosphate phosphoribosyltransferase [Chloroflexota bacterium]
MRPKQWTKNILFIFPGIVFDGKLFLFDPFIRVAAASVLLCLVAGTVYIINDLVDIERDRQHPRKRHRPLPSGQLPRNVAVAAAVLIPLFSLGLAATFSLRLAIVLLAYLLLQILYSFILKHIVLIDVMTITAGFVLRIAAGVVVIQVNNFSPWLYACGALLALFLAIGKRRQELITLGENAANTRPIYKDYNLPLLDDLLRMVTTSALIAYLLYTIEAPTRRFADQNIALITVPFVMYGLFRYLYLIYVRGEGSAPDEVLLRDRPLQVTMLLWGLTFVGILYVVPLITG